MNGCPQGRMEGLAWGRFKRSFSASSDLDQKIMKIHLCTDLQFFP